MQVGLFGGRRAVGVDHDELGIAFAPCFLRPVHEVDLRMHRVAAPDDDQVGIDDFARIDAALDADAGQPAGVGERDAEALTLT